MAAGDRALSEVLKDIIRDVQEIVRSEVRLAKTAVRTEIREEAVKSRPSALLLGTGTVAAILSTAFLLLTTVYALALVMPSWAAALIVGTALAVIACATLTAGIKRFKQINPTPALTVVATKENVEWSKQHIK
jgi:hypothetical protein